MERRDGAPVIGCGAPRLPRWSLSSRLGLAAALRAASRASDVEVEVQPRRPRSRLAVAGGSARGQGAHTSRCRSGSVPPRRTPSPAAGRRRVAAAADPRPDEGGSRARRRRPAAGRHPRAARQHLLRQHRAAVGRRRGGDRQPPERRDRAGRCVSASRSSSPRELLEAANTIDLRGACRRPDR